MTSNAASKGELAGRSPPRAGRRRRDYELRGITGSSALKGHLSVDPDSELIDEVVATPANTPDRDAAIDLLAPVADEEEKPEVLGDSAYADGATRDALKAQGFKLTAKSPPVRNATGLFTKDRFVVDLVAETVTCPAGQRVAINPTRDGGGRASFKIHCRECPLRMACTKSRSGRTISIHPHEATLQRARAEQREPGWAERYRADRPIVERKIAHFVRRSWGGRKARTRGLKRIATDLDARAGAINWARLAALGLDHDGNGWVLGGI
jgi:hypothetical protein